MPRWLDKLQEENNPQQGTGQRRAVLICFPVHGQRLARPAFLGALGPALEGASVVQPLHLPAPIMDVMSAHPSLGQGTPITGCFPVLEGPVILRSMPARPSCRHKVPFSAEAGIPPSSTPRHVLSWGGSHPSNLKAVSG